MDAIKAHNVELLTEALNAVSEINNQLEISIYGSKSLSEHQRDLIIDDLWRHYLDFRTDGDYHAVYFGKDYIWQSEDEDREWDDDKDDYAKSLKEHFIGKVTELLNLNKIICDHFAVAVERMNKK